MWQSFVPHPLQATLTVEVPSRLSFYVLACIVVACMLILRDRQSLPQFFENFSHQLCSCIRNLFALPSPPHPAAKQALVYFPVIATFVYSTRRLMLGKGAQQRVSKKESSTAGQLGANKQRGVGAGRC